MILTLLLLIVLVLGNISHHQSYVMNNFRRHVARVAYDGSNFKGFQEQERSLRTVQQTLREVFSTRCNKPVTIIGASRTDTGVHATGQAFHFDCDDIPDLDSFEMSINSMLPRDIKIFNTAVAPFHKDGKKFHACGSAIGKWYRYTFSTKRFVDPLKARYCAHMYHVNKQLDINLLNQSLQAYVGTHNFKGFGNRFERAQADMDEQGLGMEVEPFRTVESVKLSCIEDGYYAIDFRLQSALHKMVRNMVGTSWFVANGLIPLDEQLAYLRDGVDRNKNRGQAAPPEGLCLQQVYYENY